MYLPTEEKEIFAKNKENAKLGFTKTRQLKNFCEKAVAKQQQELNQFEPSSKKSTSSKTVIIMNQFHEKEYFNQPRKQKSSKKNGYSNEYPNGHI